jgi:hypothetical protein
MGTARQAGLGLVLSVVLAAHAGAEEVPWRAAKVEPSASAPSDTVTLGRPQPLVSIGRITPLAAQATPEQSGPSAFRVVRAQSQDVAQGAPPPPPPPPPAGAILGGSPEAYNCGVATDAPASTHPFLDGCWGFIKGVPTSVGGAFQSQSQRCCLQSDHAFDSFISPVSNPFFFEDPRSLTELRPVFIIQHTSHNTPIFAGSDVEYFGVQARVALTDRISLVMSKLGWTWMEVHEPTPEFHSSDGFSEIMLGPKFDIIRNDCCGTLLAAGIFFDIPAGSHRVFQDTGSLSIAPYLSFGQSFGKSSLGSFQFLNTTGFNFATDNERSEFFYSSFHLDYGFWHKFYPFMELNWFYYTDGGHALPPLGFEGRDLFNFGTSASGHSDVSLAFGFRYKFTEAIQTGFAFEFPLDGRHDLNDWRMTVDLIFRY